MQPLNETVRKNIKKYRKEKNISQQMLAKTLGVTNSSISAWETGKNELDLLRLEQICEALDISLEQAMGNGETSGEPFRMEEGMEEILLLLTDRPELKRLLETAADASAEDILVAYRLLLALKKISEREAEERGEALLDGTGGNRESGGISISG